MSPEPHPAWASMHVRCRNTRTSYYGCPCRRICYHCGQPLTTDSAVAVAPNIYVGHYAPIHDHCRKEGQ